MSDFTLARRFGLPTLVERSLHPEAAGNPRIYALKMAVRIARASATATRAPAAAAMRAALTPPEPAPTTKRSKSDIHRIQALQKCFPREKTGLLLLRHHPYTTSAPQGAVS